MIVYGWSAGAIKTLWSTADAGQGSGAVDWQIGDVNGDGRAEIIQLWRNGSSLGMIVYGWSGSEMKTFVGVRPTPARAMARWTGKIGDVNGDGRVELVQLWNNGGRLGMIVYGWVGSGMTTLDAMPDVGEGSGAVGWLSGPVQGGKVSEIVQLWNSSNRLGLILYELG